MKAFHRVVNAVGYKRVYPITDRREQCQYCGLVGGWHSQISDDHVPALNIRIPEQFRQVIRKVIVRSCMSCNSLAGDKPHMSFSERSIWIKAELIWRNRKMLKDFDVDSTLFDQADNEALSDREREQLLLLNRIGFGLPAVGSLPDDVDLVLANGLLLSEQLVQFMYAGKYSEEEADEVSTSENCDEPEENEELQSSPARRECIQMLAAEVEAQELPAFFSIEDYRDWFSRNQSRANACDLPPDLTALFDDIYSIASEATQLAKTQQFAEPREETEIREVECFDGIFSCSKEEYSALITYFEQCLFLELEKISALDAEGPLRASHVAKFWKWTKVHPEISNEYDLRKIAEALGFGDFLLDQVLAVSPKPGYVTVSWSYRAALADIETE